MAAPTMEEEIFTGKMDFALWRKMLHFARPHKSKIFALMSLGAGWCRASTCVFRFSPAASSTP